MTYLTLVSVMNSSEGKFGECKQAGYERGMRTACIGSRCESRTIIPLSLPCRIALLSVLNKEFSASIHGEHFEPSSLAFERKKVNLGAEVPKQGKHTTKGVKHLTVVFHQTHQDITDEVSMPIKLYSYKGMGMDAASGGVGCCMSLSVVEYGGYKSWMDTSKR